MQFKKDIHKSKFFKAYILQFGAYTSYLVCFKIFNSNLLLL